MKARLEFEEVAAAIWGLALPRADFIVGIARGGIVPASLLAYRLGCGLSSLRINYRDESNTPRHAAPRVLGVPSVPEGVDRILLVDDVAVTGSTLKAATDILSGFEITTIVLKGTADIVVFPEIRTCVEWPWHGRNGGREGLPVDNTLNTPGRVLRG
jgi:hypoxanthine phosphoribosyltransferase